MLVLQMPIGLTYSSFSKVIKSEERNQLKFKSEVQKMLFNYDELTYEDECRIWHKAGHLYLYIADDYSEFKTKLTLALLEETIRNVFLERMMVKQQEQIDSLTSARV